MTPAQARDSYRRSLKKAGRTVTFKRPDLSVADAAVRCRALGYEAQELGGGIVHGDTKIIALAEDFETAGWEPRKGDQALLGTRLVSVEAVDRETRRVGDILVAYEIQVRG
jgi:hypothetical protein